MRLLILFFLQPADHVPFEWKLFEKLHALFKLLYQVFAKSPLSEFIKRAYILNISVFGNGDKFDDVMFTDRNTCLFNIPDDFIEIFSESFFVQDHRSFLLIDKSFSSEKHTKIIHYSLLIIHFLGTHPISLLISL